ncbi:MAG TPA: carbohydrate ABC transporter permease, partial [Casimicrobiaceae bacterium]|nr:carbohydrate ABC transporter permease [Casimicrobiaceae bacterium]
MNSQAALAHLPRERTAVAPHRGRRTLLASAAVALLVVVLFPFVWMLQMSLRPNDDIMGYSLRFVPTLENYRTLWSGNFPKSFANSIEASLVSTMLSLLIGVPAAYALSRWRFRARRAVAMWILATRM